MKKTIKTTCGMCFSCCGMLGHFKDGQLVSITGDPDSPVNKGVLCLKGQSAIDMLNHPGRLITPLKRIGKRGQGKFVSLSWDEALDRVADKLQQARDKSGPWSTAFILGTTKGLIDTYTERFINVFGSPNIATSGHVCFLPRMFGAKATNGFFPVPDYSGNPECIILWGANLSGSRMPEHKKIIALKKKGASLIVIDPYKTKAAQQADLHIPIYPGTDLMLAMGMINVIIENNWFDKNFIRMWCTGFEELKAAAKNYSLKKVSKATRIAEDTILTLSRTYALVDKAVIQPGNAIDHGINSFQTSRAISILRAITGKLDRFGCDIEPLYPVPGAGIPEVTLSYKITDEIWRKRIGPDPSMLPWFRRVLPADIIHTLNTETPYKLSCVYITGANPLLTFSNAGNAYKALQKADFLVVSDRFMTPTAKLADIILPPATFLEYDSVVAPPYYSDAGVQQALVQTENAMSDYDIINGLAKRLGFEKMFYPDTHDFFDLVLGPSNLTFEEFKNIGTLTGRREEKKYINNGFQTPSKKVELFSNFLGNAGFPPLPVFTPVQDLSEEYPLILTSNKSSFFRHSDNRQLKKLRNAHPEPRVKIHPDTAKQFHIKENDQVFIETQNGGMEQKARITDKIMQGVIFADFGWWFPEDETNNGNWRTCNINMVTSDLPPFSPEIGSTRFRDIPCRISTAQSISVGNVGGKE